MADSFEQGVIWAVNHSGDSDSTGLIAGHLLGIQLGAEAIPARWLDKLELREVIEQVAEDLEQVPQQYCGQGGEHDDAIWARYPGW
ncbi:ADP-ribosyl-[dinitrogen reductase] hydrolase [compost metagenome]